MAVRHWEAPHWSWSLLIVNRARLRVLGDEDYCEAMDAAHELQCGHLPQDCNCEPADESCVLTLEDGSRVALSEDADGTLTLVYV